MEDFQQCPNIFMVNTRTTAGLSDILWLADEENLLVASDSGELEIWHSSSKQPGCMLEQRGSLQSHDDMALCVCHLEGTKVVSGGADGQVIVWDVAAARHLTSYRGK